MAQTVYEPFLESVNSNFSTRNVFYIFLAGSEQKVGSFSTVSAPIFASKHAFFNIFKFGEIPDSQRLQIVC